MDQFVLKALVACSLWLAPPSLLAQDIEAMKRSLEAQIGLYQQVNDHEHRIRALEQDKDGPAAVGHEAERTTAAALAPTSHEAIQFALSMYRGVRPEHTFVDIGCGDGRVLIAAVRKWGCKGVGYEIDPQQAELARKCVEAAGLSDRIEIREGDATALEIKADAGFAYLYPETLDALSDTIAKIPAFVSYQHPVSGLKETKSEHGRFYSKDPQQVKAQTVKVVPAAPYADWGGRRYYQEYNRNCNCAMCQSIRGQLAIPRTATVTVQPNAQAAPQGRWVKQCINGVCQMVWVEG